MANFPTNVGPGLFVPTTEIFDTSFLEGKDISSPEFKQFIKVLTERINDISLQLNLKDTGIYSEEEFVNSQVFFPNPSLSPTTAQNPTQRQVFRKVINFGALPAITTKTVAHGITIDANTSFTRIYGVANRPGLTFIPLPYSSSTLSQNISVSVGTANITIKTAADFSPFTTTYVVLEYIKQ